MTSSLSERGGQIAAWIAGTHERTLPGEVIEQAKKNLADFLGVSLGACHDPAVTAVRASALSWRAAGSARIFLHQTTTPALAALVNATMAHAMDFDDGLPGGGGHPSAPLWSATLALGGHLGLSGEALIRSYVTGFEVMARLGGGGIEGVGRNAVRQGFHPTGLFGTPACAAAASALLGLSEREAAHAMGVAATMSSGLVASFGTHSKPFHAGMAAMDGIMAAQLAASGFEAATDLFELNGGYLKSFIQGREVQAVPPMQFDHWEILQTSFKPYACCAAAHASVQAARALAPRIGARRVSRVQAKLFPNALFMASHMNPVTPLECKFSIPFCIAMGLRDYALVGSDFGEAVLRDRAVTDIVPLVQCQVVDEQPLEEAHLEVWLEDGEHLSADVETVIGHPRNPMGWEALRVKYSALVTPVLDEKRAARLFEITRAFDKPGAAQELLAMLADDGGGQ